MLNMSSKLHNEEQWQAVLAKDARFDGQFVFAVTSTGVYCRPSCPSRRAHRERVKFYDLPEAAEQAGFRACLRCEPQRTHVLDPQIELVQRVCRLLNSSDGETVGLAELASQTGVSVFHLQRTFKRVMGISPKQYLAARRFGNFKELVRKGESVTSSLYESGFNSSSRLYEHAAEELGMTPATYSRGGRGVNINYTTVESPLGRLLVAVTERGVCAVRIADSGAEDPESSRSQRAASRSAARYPSDCISASGVGEAARDSLRPNGFVRRSRKGVGQTGRGACSWTRVGDESGGARNSVSSRGARRQEFGRLSLGIGAEKEIAGTRKWATLFVRRFRVR